MTIEKVIIVNFGSQFTQLILKKVRKCRCYCKIVALDELLENIDNCKAVILSGGPESIDRSMKSQKNNTDYQKNIIEKVIERKIPILAICYGFQLIAKALGGEVASQSKREYGAAQIHIEQDQQIFEGFWQKKRKYNVWMSHSDHVIKLPNGFQKLASTDDIEYAIAADEKRKIYATQFHPEVSQTTDGIKLIEQFLFKIAHCTQNWSITSYKEQAIREIKNITGEKSHAICALSGGVDSTVAAVLTHRAIGERLHCILVDTGLMRYDETNQIHKTFCQELGIPLQVVHAESRFLTALKNVSDPEKKRKIIGNLFIEIFEKHATEIGSARADFLVQGTLYPDFIESKSVYGNKTVTIKSHHNVGGLPENMKIKIIEPLKELFKDEVREIGQELDIPPQFIKRHPFPGPGLAIRIPGKVTKKKCDMLRKADSIYLEEIHKAGLYDDIWQAFAVLLPVKTVGVMGDSRSYEYACALRAVKSTDGMTAEIFPFNPEFLHKTATRLVNEVPGINRVLYDCTTKPPGTIEWE